MIKFLHKYYLSFLHYLCKKELKKISRNQDTYSLTELIQWHDLMAIECINGGVGTSQERIMGICVATAWALEEKLNESCS